MIGFLTQAVRNYKTTGAVAPSSAALARVMTRSLSRRPSPKRVLEVGPGSGAFTKHILSALKPGDEIEIIEINDSFCRHLERTVLAPFRAAHPEIMVRLHHAPVQTADVKPGFDDIICGLPFNNFPLSEVSRIFRRMMSLLKDDGELTYFEYLGMKVVKMPWVGMHGRQRLRRRIAMGRVLDRRYDGRSHLVLRNFPPAHAFRLRA